MNPTWRRNYLRYKSFFLNIVARYKDRTDLKAYLEILLSLATVSFFAVFALRPTLLTIGGLLKDIEAKEETIATMNGKIQNLSKAQSLYDREKNKIDLLKTAIPENSSPEVFARQIEGLSGKHQVSITKLSVKDAVILGKQKKVVNKQDKELQETFPKEASSLSFSLAASGQADQYSSLLSFLSDLETLRRPIKIDNLRFSVKRETDQSTISLAVEGRLPYLVELEK